MEDSHIHLFIFCLWLPSTQEMSLHMDTTRVNTKIRLIIFLATKDEEILYSQQKKKKKKPDLELTVAQIMKLLIAKLRLKLKKVEKTTRSFRFALNQISYTR